MLLLWGLLGSVQLGLVACQPSSFTNSSETQTTAATSPATALPCDAKFLGDWLETSPLPVAFESHAMVALGDFLYVIGGWNESGGARTQVYVASLRAEGSVGDWQETKAPLPKPLQHHTAIAHNNTIYVFGGDNGFGGTVSDSVFQAIPAANGDITEWTEVARLPASLTLHGMTRVGDRVYLMGGVPRFDAAQADPLDTIYMAELGALSEPEPFQTTTPLPVATAWLAAASTANQIYAVGGRLSLAANQLSNQVWVANVMANGQLSAFRNAGAIEPRARHTATVIDGNLLATGGGGASAVLDTVPAASLDDNGQLLGWTPLVALPEPRYGHAALVHNGYFYLSGGFSQYSSFKARQTVFVAPICSER
ncbi:MAG: 4-oxalocrotonate tautomerase [Cyanothece sp. SIO1E1]|nr:4-oxalocrotonate tautomerase [Cyanothece sp. SIO1E1]